MDWGSQMATSIFPARVEHNDGVMRAVVQEGNHRVYYECDVGEACWWFPYHPDNHPSVMTLANPIFANAFIFGNPVFGEPLV